MSVIKNMSQKNYVLTTMSSKVVITLNKSQTNEETKDGDSIFFLRTPS